MEKEEEEVGEGKTKRMRRLVMQDIRRKVEERLRMKKEEAAEDRGIDGQRSPVMEKAREAAWTKKAQVDSERRDRPSAEDARSRK